MDARQREQGCAACRWGEATLIPGQTTCLWPVPIWLTKSYANQEIRQRVHGTLVPTSDGAQCATWTAGDEQNTG